MSWATKTRGEIKLTSPNGNEFIALWKGDERSFEKKIGRFDPPNVRGSIAQDLDTKSVEYPLTLYFSGLNHYDVVESFFIAAKDEKGIWTVVHPTKGTLKLQLISYKENILPIETGNFTQIDTTWFEPALIETIVSKQQSITELLSSAYNLAQDSIAQISQLRSDLYSAVQSAVNMVNKVNGLANASLSELAATDTVVSDAWQSAKISIDNAIENFKSDPSGKETQEEIGQAVIDIITIPLQSSNNYDTRTTAYEEILTSIMDSSPSGATVEDYNSVVFQEISIMAVLISICQIIATSNFTTRSEIISAIDKITVGFNDAISALETVQSQFDDNDIDLQYISESTAYTSIQILFAQTARYLISQFFNMKSEKRFTLKSDRSPIEITITEYGDMGENDSNYDLFLSSNNITNKNILFLPAGTEVVIYA